MTLWQRDVRGRQAGSRKPSVTLRPSCFLEPSSHQAITSPSCAGATTPPRAMCSGAPLPGQARCGYGTGRPVDPQRGVAQSEQRREGPARLLPSDHEPLPDHTKGKPGSHRCTGLDLEESSCTCPAHRQWHWARNVDLQVAVSRHRSWPRVHVSVYAACARTIRSTQFAEHRGAYAAWSFRVSMTHIVSRRRSRSEGHLRSPAETPLPDPHDHHLRESKPAPIRRRAH